MDAAIPARRLRQVILGPQPRTVHTAINASATGDLLEQVPEGRPQWTRGHPIVDDLDILAHRHAGAEARLEAQRDVAEALKQAMMPPFQDAVIMRRLLIVSRTPICVISRKRHV
jgi:hypothetical protein